MPADPSPSSTSERLAGPLLVVAAALLWSTGGLFAKAPVFGSWPLESRGMLLAFWRALFAGLVLLPFARGVRWRPALVPMSAAFVAMNVTYLTAMTVTTAANAIWLQSTAPVWVTLFGCLWLGERVSRQDLMLVATGAAGVAVILFFEARGQSAVGVAYGLASGITYAGVVLSLRWLRGENAAWLVALNHLVAAGVLLPFVVARGVWPSAAQLPVLAAFGVVQMGVPYVLFARGLRRVTGAEAACIGLLEPVLLPLWVYLGWGEEPQPWTLAGATLILLGMLARYGVALARERNRQSAQV